MKNFGSRLTILVIVALLGIMFLAPTTTFAAGNSEISVSTENGYTIRYFDVGDELPVRMANEIFVVFEKGNDNADKPHSVTEILGDNIPESIWEVIPKAEILWGVNKIAFNAWREDVLASIADFITETQEVTEVKIEHEEPVTSSVITDAYKMFVDGTLWEKFAMCFAILTLVVSVYFFVCIIYKIVHAMRLIFDPIINRKIESRKIRLERREQKNLQKRNPIDDFVKENKMYLKNRLYSFDNPNATAWHREYRFVLIRKFNAMDFSPRSFQCLKRKLGKKAFENLCTLCQTDMMLAIEKLVENYRTYLEERLYSKDSQNATSWHLKHAPILEAKINNMNLTPKDFEYLKARLGECAYINLLELMGKKDADEKAEAK